MHRPVSIKNVRRLLSVAKLRGYSRKEILQHAHLKDEILNQNEVCAEHYTSIYNAIILLLQDECLGFYGPGTVPLGTTKVLCCSVLSSRSLQEAIERTYEFTRLFCQLKYGRSGLPKAIKLSSDSPHVIVELPTLADPGAEHQMQQAASASALSALHQFHSWLIDAYIPLQGILLAGDSDHNVDKYRRIFDCEPVFNAGCDALVFDKVFLQAKIKQNSDTLETFLSIGPSYMVSEREIGGSEKTLAGEMEKLFAKNIRRLPSLAQCADMLNISERTLKRRLRESGQTFQNIKDDFRKKHASNYLTDSTLSNDEIALLMGFDDIRNFYKAFKRWHGITPKQFRDSLVESEVLE